MICIEQAAVDFRQSHVQKRLDEIVIARLRLATARKKDKKNWIAFIAKAAVHVEAVVGPRSEAVVCSGSGRGRRAGGR